MRDLYMKNGQGFVLVYSIVSRSTFEDLNEIREHILRIKDNAKVPMILVGNKSDLRDTSNSLQVSTAEAEQRAQSWGIPFLEVSAKRRINVDEVFFKLVRLINQSDAAKQQASKSKKKKKCIVL